MLKIYDFNNPTNVIPLQLEDDKRYVTHKFNGYDTLTFEIENNHKLYKYIAEEVKIEDEKNRYIIKKIDEHSDFVTAVCEVDLDDWKEVIFEAFRTTNKMLSEVLSLIIPDGWSSIGDSIFSLRTTIEESEGQPFYGVNALDILPTVAEVYSCTFQFDTINKTIEIINPKSFEPSGYFFTDELNLKSLGFVGDSTNFATRLYAYGKREEDGTALTFADINNGKPYVEDYSYSNKVISVGWSDERYTVKENLLEAAKEKLKELSYPVRSYTCEADNLGEGTWLYQIVTLVDRKRKTRVNHQVVEYKEYPNHVGDSITLSMVAPKVESYVSRVESDLKKKLEDKTHTIQKEIEKAIEYATQQITGNKGGCFKWIFDGNGNPQELLNLGDTEDVNTAKKVWRWNASGLGHSNNGYNGPYTLALLADGSVNASAITTGVLTANIIRAGKLTDLRGLNYWDLETGDFRLTANTKVGDKTLAEFTQGGFDSLTQEEIFNKLTNDGQTMGIYLDSQTNSLYLNASYMKTGTLRGVEIIADSGTIGGFTITPTKIYGGSSSLGLVGLQVPASNNSWAIWAGAPDVNNLGDAPFRVSRTGKLYATDASLEGTLTSTSSEAYDNRKTVISGGRLKFYDGSTKYGGIFASTLNNYNGIRVEANSFYVDSKEILIGDGINGTLTFQAPVSMNSDGTAASWKTVKLVVKGGVVCSGSSF